MKITLVISALGCGGAERVLVSLAQGFVGKEHDVTVVTLSEKNTDFYQLPQECTRLDLDIMSLSSNSIQALLSNIKRVKVLRKAIKSSAPDVVISFLRITNIQTIIALLGTNYPIVITEHNDPKVFSYGKLWETLRKLVYPLSSLIVSVSNGVDLSFESLPKNKRAVIYNPIVVKDDGYIDKLSPKVDLTKNWLVSMGRLTNQKGFDLLLQAFHKVAPRYNNWQLLILGKGELREELEQIRDNLGLSNQVIFTGAVTNPFAVLKKSKIFVMASRNEGFPMAHAESLACGLPVVATDCPSGPSEMIRHNVDGLLVPNKDVEALAIAMESLMSDESKRLQFADKAPEILERFGQEAIIEKWESLIQKLVMESMK